MKILVIGQGKAGGRWAELASTMGHVVVKYDARMRGVTLADAFLTEPDAAIVATPPATHFALAAECVNQELPVLVEKPLSDTMAPWESLDGLIVPVTNYRWHPALIDIKRQIDKGELGRVVGLRAEYVEPLAQWQPSYDCSPWQEAAVHLIDYAHWLYSSLPAVGPGG